MQLQTRARQLKPLLRNMLQELQSSCPSVYYYLQDVG
jgi:hypothetical protein